MGLSFSLILYFRNKKNKEIPTGVLYLMSALRFVCGFIISFLLLNIFLKQVKNDTQEPVILLAIDNSKSMMASADSNFIKTDFLKNINELKGSIASGFNVKTILFGERAKTSEENPAFTEKETDIDNLITEVENNYSNQNIGALIVVSDGIYNKGSNPVYQAEKLQYPVYTVATGDTNEIRDVSVRKINHNQFAYLGNIFPAEVVISAKKYSGKEVTVSLTDPKGKVQEQKIKIVSDNFLTQCTFTMNADVAGVQRYKTNVTVLDDEKNVSNNSQSFVVEIIDNRSKILLLANYPHPDVSSIKDALLNNTSYELEYALFNDFKKPVKPYSLVIVHGFSQNNSSLINDCRNNNIPVWIINPQTSENLPGVKISSSFNKQNDAEATINNSFGLFNISDELKKFVKDLPAVKTFFGNYSVNNGTHILINQKIGVVETENPVLLFTESNGLKNSVFIGDGLWRWKMRDFAEHKNSNLFNELISKCVQYLSVKSDKSFFRITSPKIVNENEVIELGAEVYNKTYELITEPDVTLMLTNTEKKQFNYTFSKTSNAYKLNLGFLPAGEYVYEAKVKTANELFVKKGSILVKEVIAERLNTVANHQMLYQLSYRTGGKLFYASELKKLADEISKNQLIKPITYSSNSTTSLIDLKWLFYLILALLSLEWFFRKRYSSI
ncbi:MAG: hypothetical protein K0S32_3674 [Bacteroidetes bacterium]|nr:hypothetical protein [Bacteroidota bacterium]